MTVRVSKGHEGTHEEGDVRMQAVKARALSEIAAIRERLGRVEVRVNTLPKSIHGHLLRAFCVKVYSVAAVRSGGGSRVRERAKAARLAVSQTRYTAAGQTEELLQMMLKLDGIEANGDADIRSARREAVRAVQALEKRADQVRQYADLVFESCEALLARAVDFAAGPETGTPEGGSEASRGTEAEAEAKYGEATDDDEATDNDEATDDDEETDNDEATDADEETELGSASAPSTPKETKRCASPVDEDVEPLEDNGDGDSDGSSGSDKLEEEEHLDEHTAKRARPEQTFSGLLDALFGVRAPVRRSFTPQGGSKARSSVAKPSRRESRGKERTAAAPRPMPRPAPRPASPLATPRSPLKTPSEVSPPEVPVYRQTPSKGRSYYNRRQHPMSPFGHFSDGYDAVGYHSSPYIDPRMSYGGPMEYARPRPSPRVVRPSYRRRSVDPFGFGGLVW